MTAFSNFFSAMLSSVAEFLWSDSIKWIVGIMLLLGIVTIIKRIIK